jgi:hypothetical protein
MHAIRGGVADWQTPVSKNTGQTNFDQTCRERLRQAIRTGGKFLPDLVYGSSTQSRTKLTRCGVSFRVVFARLFESRDCLSSHHPDHQPALRAGWRLIPSCRVPDRGSSLHKMAQDFRAAANPQASGPAYPFPGSCRVRDVPPPGMPQAARSQLHAT